ncbi:MAG: hypothetical protein ABJB66_14385 [Gemmatimonadaceae bacterium]
MKQVLRALFLLAMPVSFLGAQLQPKSFSVTTRVGSITAERAASLDAAALLGLDTEYALTKWFGIGTAIDVSRGNTTKEDFLGRYRYGSATSGGGDSIYYQYLGQPVNTVDLSAIGVVRYPAERISPFLMGGVGTYVMLLDAQVSNGAKRKVALSYTGGAGIVFKISNSTGVQLDARAVTYTNYDRSFLDPSKGRLPNFSFPQDFPLPPAAKKTALSTLLTLGFRYIPGAAGGKN